MSNEQKYYSLTLSWSDTDRERGTFDWSGWAVSGDDAEAQARQEMYAIADPDDLPEGAPEEGVWEGGRVIAYDLGANKHAAPQVANMIEDLLDEDLPDGMGAGVRDKLSEIMELLRPGFAEMNRNSPTAEIEPPVAPRP